MTPQQISLVQRSWTSAVQHQNEVTRSFYEHLFVLDPTLRTLFRDDIEAQRNKLAQALDFIVMSLGKLDILLPMAQRLAARHVGYGVKPEYYDTVGTALLSALAGALGTAFDDKTEAAWAAAYIALSQAMIDSAYAKQD